MKIIKLALVSLLLSACGTPQYIVDRDLRRQELSMIIAANEAAAKERNEAINADIARWELDRKKRYEERTAEIKAQYERGMAAIHERKRQADELEKRQADELAKKPPAKIGMSTTTVREKTNWGSPKSVNRTTTSQGVMEQWVYEGGQYLYFRNGKLYAIQN